MPWVTRSKPPYLLAFGKDNTHLRLCKGLFAAGCQDLLFLGEVRMGAEVVPLVLIIAIFARKTDKPAGEKTFPSYLGFARRGRVTV